MGLICLLDDLLRFIAGKALLSFELKLLKLAVLFLWIHNRTLNNSSGGCWANQPPLVELSRGATAQPVSRPQQAHLRMGDPSEGRTSTRSIAAIGIR